MQEKVKLFHKSGKYDWFVSTDGAIIRVTNGKKKGIIRETKSYVTGGQQGSQYLALSINDADEKYIHRIVAKAFIPNPEGKLSVNHIDCDKTNNHVSNLEWVTYAENMKHAIDNGRNTMHARKLTFEQANDIRELWETTDLKQTEIARMYSVHQNTIKQIIDNKTYREDV